MTSLQTGESLDPEDWDEVRATFHLAVDRCIDAMRTVRDRPVWQPTPDGVKARLCDPVPRLGEPFGEVLEEFDKSIRPYATGNTHPRFFGWVHGSGSVAGALGEMLAAFMNSNAGGRDHAATYVERQVIDWCREIFGFPASASGILTTGTSMGTLIAFTVARNALAPIDVRKNGVGALAGRMVGYTSAEGHCCLAKSFEMLGLGHDALRKVPVNSRFQMDTAQLRRMVAADLASGLRPFLVCATAGTVNTGAIDDIAAIADVCEAHGLWLHVDGAFGALAILTPEYRERMAAISRADSIAFDFHKWLHVPYDAGCVLVRDEEAHRASFSARREYLAGRQQGLAGGDPWFCEYGPELSRGFRALKVWFTIKAYGIDRLAQGIAGNCEQARFLGDLVRAASHLELLAAVPLNIVCFRYAPPGLSEPELDALNAAIVADLQLQGIAAPSTTRVNGRLAIRVALTNHRTTDADLELLAAEVCRLGREAICG
jgi:glutamate/tyrosine decarboxylase-like PLP-dependent enzyme